MPERFILKPTIDGWLLWDSAERMVVDSGPDEESGELVNLASAMNSLDRKLNGEAT